MADPLLGNLQNGGVGFAGLPRAGKDFPGLKQQVLISWVFIIASVFLVLDFLFLQLGGPTHPDSYFATHPNVSYLAGVVSCIFWLLGFILLTHWHIYSISDTRSLGFLGTLLKLLAAVFFNMQPLTALWDETATGSVMGSAAGSAAGPSPMDWMHVSPGDAYLYMFGWSDFLGIVLFHTGNVCSVVHMMSPATQLFDYSSPYRFSNLPVWGMWVYLTATTFLVICNALGYFGDNDSIPEEYGLFWWFTALCQYAGSGLLLAGSLIYLYWSTATRRSAFACITP